MNKITYYPHGSREENKIALTFDDGPNPHITNAVLDILKDKNVKATFFLIGSFVEQNIDIVRRIVNEGHQVGNHSFTHIADFEEADALFRKLDIPATEFIRPPKLDMNPLANLPDTYLKDKKVVNFDLDSYDYRKDVKEEIIATRVKIIVRNGSIIDFHDGSETADEQSTRALPLLQVLPGLIDDLKVNYQLVRCDELSLISYEKEIKTTKEGPNVTQKLLIRYGDEVMMQQHPHGVLDFPGGRLEFGEELIPGLVREIEEELGIKIEEPITFIDTWNYISSDKMRHSIMLYYKVTLSKKPTINSPEGLRPLWFTKDQMNKMMIIGNPIFLDKIFS